jgi:MinD superfamily P-loop ATPase
MIVGTARNNIMLEIDENVCRACGKCQAKAVCRGNAIRVIDRGEAPYLDSTRCWGCMVCVTACPFDAIKKHEVS